MTPRGAIDYTNNQTQKKSVASFAFLLQLLLV